ncbi:GNAT family N-acetyltransferase [Sulfurimonas sp. SWIR-19]|uniref:GNAT family N-acetyltransferase n=1 Tax=Sulfurimonas sp. SWIR-19 TaxID=2878390 RepID=UPI001CF462B4|nr:GNAT family N-acetyltransferase [Sulfurimonas sp. SWIR-19]UCM99318.1 GNAT family N-acetyltransferase [Sulfurimonas sp. SWIR-19]
MPSIISLSDITRSKFDRLKKSFTCSNAELEKHIKQYAFNHQKEGLFQTYFYVDDNDNFLGYISVSIATIERSTIEDELNISSSIKYSIPAMKITRLCVFDNFCNNGVGSILMTFANILAVVQQKKIGCRALIVDSKFEAIEFYQRFGFIEIDKEVNSDTMFMVFDIAKPSDVKEITSEMISFCEVFNQEDLIEILR